MEKIRLGGMALQNGVLVHGPTSWAAAVRDPGGGIHVASGVKRRFAPGVTTPVVRGPLRLAEAFAVLPDVKRHLPQARFPFERPAVAGAVVAGSVLAAAARRAPMSAVAKEAVAALASLAPAALALRGGELASYHGAEHVSIGTYERNGETAPKEHDRCGSHLIGPLLASSAVAGVLASRAPQRTRGIARLAGAVGAAGRVRRAVRVDGAAPWEQDRPGAGPAGVRAPAPAVDGRAVPGPARGGRARARGLPRRRGCRSGEPRRLPSAGMSLAPSRVRGDRLPPEVFDLPVEKMREGYYTDAYFNHTRAALLHDGHEPRVVMQVFQKHHAMLGGMDEAIAVLKLCATDWDDLTVHALHDGDWIEPWEAVMEIEGTYTHFAHLETVYLGVLARRTLISTNVARVLEAARGKPIIFMPARHDHHRVQTGDGYAAHVAGAVLETPVGVTSDAQASWWGGRGVGTVPHALIASYGGNTVLAATKFADWAPPDFRITVLVDFENDSVRTSLEAARALGPRLWGVRLDTSGQLVDRSLWDEMGDFDPRGVNERLVRKVRDALDADGFERVKIVVSGGFTVEKIRAFEQREVPVDAYGVGSSLIRGENDFTGDIVLCDGRPASKVGRTHRPSPRLELVT